MSAGEDTRAPGIRRKFVERSKERPVVMVPVKRIGKHTRHHYCERCGQKRRACECDPEPEPES